MARIKKRYIVLGLLSLLIFVLLFFASTIAKNWLVKNSEKLTGRKLDIGEIHINYAKVAIQVKDLVLFEANKTDSFASFSELYVNFDPWTLLQNEYSFSEIRLVKPRVQVIQDGEKFNFSSMIPKEDSLAVKDTTKQNKVLKFTIRNIQLIDGKVKYQDLQKNNLVEMKKMNLNLPLIAWNNEQSNMGVDFNMGEKGQVNVQATVDNLKKKYQIDLRTKDIDLQPITNYLKDYFDVRSVNGLLSSKMKITGDMNEVINISLSGKGSVTDFSMVDGRSEKILASPKVFVSISDINLKTFHFGFGKIEVNEPQLLVVRDKKMTNLERLLLPYFRSDSISSSSGTTTSDETPVTYKIDTLKINNGLVAIADKTLNRPFKYDLNDFNMTMTGLSESADKIPVVFNTKLNNRGELSGKTVWSMTDPMNLEMEAKVKRMDLVSFSPYTEYYVASPITQGWLNYDLGLKMTTKALDNQNGIKVDELEFGKRRTKDTTAMRVPVRLALYLMKDANDEIKFELPVTGNPSDPKFKLGKIIWKTFANLMVKTAVSPFKALAGLAGTNPESLEKLPFNYAQDSLDNKQRDDLAKLALIMKKKPDLIVTLAQTTDPEEEMARIAVRLAKEDFLSTQPTEPNGTKTTAKQLNDDNPELMAFIRKTVPTVDSIGINQACLKLIDSGRIETRFQSIMADRNRLVTELLTVNQGIPAASVNVSTADLRTLPKELRVPQFKVEVSIK
jgi:hypothetical protein